MARKAEIGRHRIRRQGRQVRGQSLVEMAVALPLLLFIVAGVAEVGNIFVQKNRAALVSRETARFVATGGDDNDSLSVSLQSVQAAFGGQVLAFDEDHMNIYVIHATISSNGSVIIDDGDPDVCADDDDFCETHIYPTEQYYVDNYGGVDQDPYSNWTSAQVYERLSNDDDIADSFMEDLKVVAVVVQYNTTTILDLPIFPQTQGGIPLNEITIMRQEATISEAAGTPTQGCSAYPIVVSDDALAGVSAGDTVTATFGTGSGNFNYLLWNSDSVDTEAQRLASSLGHDQYPGDPPLTNSKDATHGYIDPEDPADTSLHKTDLVLRSTGTGSADALTMMNDHISEDRAIRILTYSSYNGGLDAFEIGNVIIVELTGSSMSNLTTDSLEFEFVRYDSSCGN